MGYVEKYVHFNISSTVQVFETTIRALGGLLSSHLYASMPRLGQVVEGYDGQLLELAYDLGLRLLPAFDTETGIPHPRVNLQLGVVPIGNEYITETCSSGAGTMLLEFGLLSRLTGDPRFEKVARRAFLEIWARRSNLDLVGMIIDSDSGLWQSPITGNGANIDSFYEYALKYYILFGDDHFNKIFEKLYSSLNAYSFDGWRYQNIHFQAGTIMIDWIDSLAAFFPGLQVLAGKVEDAIKTHLVYYKLWKAYGGIPERWSGFSKDPIRSIILEWYGLRPEFIESSYYLYQATKDPFYLHVGEQVVYDLNEICKVACGFAGIQDIRIGNLSDRMETFFLSETVKYLYLLFNPNHQLNTEFSNFIFSTEAHPLWYDKYVINHSSVQKYPKLRSKVTSSLSQIVSAVSEDEFKGIKSFKTKSISPFRLLNSLWEKWESRLFNKKRFHSTPTRARYINSCPAWKNSNKNWFSSIASWDNFFSLDGYYNFTSPNWLENKRSHKSKTLHDNFFSDYVDPMTTCSVDTRTSVELIFAIPEGSRRSELIADRDMIRVDGLSGLRLKLMKVSSDLNHLYEQNGYQVAIIDDVNVDDRLIEVSNLYISQEGEPSMKCTDDGKLLLQDYEIFNVMINNH